jgi:hypothetical protein
VQKQIEGACSRLLSFSSNACTSILLLVNILAFSHKIGDLFPKPSQKLGASHQFLGYGSCAFCSQKTSGPRFRVSQMRCLTLLYALLHKLGHFFNSLSSLLHKDSNCKECCKCKKRLLGIEETSAKPKGVLVFQGVSTQRTISHEIEK